MSKNLLIIISLALCTVFVFAATKEDQTVIIKADYCAVFEVGENQTEKLVLDIDAFADAHDWMVDKSSPVSIVYKDRLTKNIMILRILFGDFGSVLSHYSINGDSSDSNVLVELKRYIREQLESKYVVKKCSELENFKIPELNFYP
ncbi:MAG: hypothetical protein K0U59_12525 [Gammaproteobacteria bacterium]|nr:hypothetical protein [Gammaproteobacteria bacterium]